ncbi:MAG: hypothetical protein H0U03_08930 [Actinobacteria bacterium]|nr:hypothetical protein [Actinomycetota bacterium]
MMVKRVAAALALVVALSFGVGQVTGQADAARKGKGGGAVVFKAAATYLGLDKKQLMTSLRGGQSLAQIATAQGKSVAGLKAAILSALQARLAKGVSDGKITSAQAAQRLTRLESKLDRLINRTGTAKAGKHKHAAGKVVLKAAAAYIGLDRRQLKAGLQSGKSLAQLATAQGKSVDGLKAAILGAFKSQLEKAVAANKLTAAQAQKLLTRFEAHLDRLVNRTRTPKSP